MAVEASKGTSDLYTQAIQKKLSKVRLPRVHHSVSMYCSYPHTGSEVLISGLIRMTSIVGSTQSMTFFLFHDIKL